MSQAWLQVFGLILEFFGVLLLAWEWFAAQRQDAAERALAARQAQSEASMEQMQRLRTPDPTMQRHYEMSRDMQRRMTDTRVAETRASYGGLRTRAVAAALLFVVAGFALQLLGSWPGCCRAFGIMPLG